MELFPMCLLFIWIWWFGLKTNAFSLGALSLSSSLPPPFACEKATTAKSTSTASATSWSEQQQSMIADLFSICTHLQNPKFYDAAWANRCHHDFDDGMLLTSKDVCKGEILSLLPIHAIGLSLQNDNQQNCYNDLMIVHDCEKDDKASFLPRPSTPKCAWLTSASSLPFRYDLCDLVEVPQTTTHIVPMNVLRNMYVAIDPNHTIQPGWIGHLASYPSSPLFPFSQDDSNCCVLALAPPVCALFATKDLIAGTPLIVQRPNNVIKDERRAFFFFNHREDIEELQNLVDMAYPPKAHEEDWIIQQQQVAAISNFSSSSFYNLPRNYPNLQEIHKDPDILSVPNFLTKQECDSLIATAKTNLVPCLTHDPMTGEVEIDSSRTSQNANIAQSEFPTIVDKLSKLANCTSDHLEILQVLHYSEGQYFQPHTDGFTGPTTACGFYNSARLVTIFVYLNTARKGGTTRFTRLSEDLEDIQPEQGTAIIHFPTTLQYEEDIRTQHEGTPAIDDKWLLVTWVWMHPREERSIYAEKWLEPISE